MIFLDRTKVLKQMRRYGIMEFREVAAYMSVAPQTLSMWFAGKPFSTSVLETMCYLFDCQPEDLITVDFEVGDLPWLPAERPTLVAPQVQRDPPVRVRNRPRRSWRRPEAPPEPRRAQEAPAAERAAN